MRRQGSQSELERTRLLAADMFEQKLDTKIITAILKVDDQSVRRWRRILQTKGRQGLLSQKHPGRRRRLDDQQKQLLAAMLLKTPKQWGFDSYLWTQQIIADLILREFGASYHHDYVGVILHELGFSHQKPARRAQERNEPMIEAWRREVWPEILKTSAASNGVILMADEVGFMMTPSVKKTWALVAQTPVVPYRNRRQKKVSVLGAVALHSASGVLDLLCDFYPDSYVRGEQAGTFLHRVLAQYPQGPIDLVWDNLSAHKCKIVKAIVAQHPRLTLHYLPPYAPDLNAVEGVWCQAKHHRMANHTISELEVLHAEARRHLTDIGSDQDLLRSCFNGAKLALSVPSGQ
jgi:transposase